MNVAAERAVAGLRRQFGGDRRRLIGIAMSIGYGSGWAACTVWLRRIMDNYPLHPTGVIFWRDVIISVLLFAILLPRRGLRIERRHLPLMVLFGFIGIALNNASWGLSVNLNGVTIATVLAYGAPVFTVLLSRPLYGERITTRKMASLALALSGCLLVSQVYDIGQMSLHSFGIIMAVAVALTQAGRDLVGKKVGGLYPALTALFYGFLFGSIFLGVGQPRANLVAHLPLQGWVELLLMSAGVMASYAMYVGALARLPVSIVSILGLSEAVVAALLAYLVHGELLAPLQLVGAVLVISGVLVLEVRNE
ncbi:MAG: DMT family transporter [Anaerolineae bacterium]